MKNEQVIKGDKHATGSALIFSDEETPRILLLHHAKFDVWMQPGGHRERDENPLEAAIREAEEETGIDISKHVVHSQQVAEHVGEIPAPRFLAQETIPAYKDQPEHVHIDHFYVAQVPWQEPVLEDGKALGIKWFDVDELDSIDTLEELRVFVKIAFDELLEKKV